MYETMVVCSTKEQNMAYRTLLVNNLRTIMIGSPIVGELSLGNVNKLKFRYIIVNVQIKITL